MRRLLASLALPALLITAPALAQQTDEQLWVTATASTGIGEDTRLALESIARFSDRAGGFFHDEFGFTVSRPLSKKVEFLIGYRHVEDYDHGRAKPNEERLRQQFTIAWTRRFATRFRFEERFQSTSGAVAVRLRPQVRFNFPLNGKGLSLLATQEHFLNLNGTGWGVRSGYERMRNTIGLSIPLSPKLKGELGYLNQYRFGRGGARDQMDHIATVSLALNL
jgi:hypothetical protein